LALKAALCLFRFAFISLLFLIYSRPAKVELNQWSKNRGPAQSISDQPTQQPNEQSINDDMSNYCITRHDGKNPVVMTFLDSSVRSVGLRQLWGLNWSTTFDPRLQNSRTWPTWILAYN
ncbi:MAG: hypothetical protein ACLQU4_07665, partial [Limisphaerales bacterium]